MSTFGLFQSEIDKCKASLSSQQIASKTSKQTLAKVETDLRQAILKSRNGNEERVDIILNQIFKVILELVTRDDLNDRLRKKCVM